MKSRYSVQCRRVKLHISFRHVGIDGLPLVMDDKIQLFPADKGQLVLRKALDRNTIGAFQRFYRICIHGQEHKRRRQDMFKT